MSAVRTPMAPKRAMPPSRAPRALRFTCYLRSRGRCAKRLKFLNRKGGRVV